MTAVAHVTSSETYPDSLVAVVWKDLLLRKELAYVRTEDWDTDAEFPVEWFAEPALEWRSKKRSDVVFNLDSAVVRGEITAKGHVSVSVAAPDRKVGDRVFAGIKKALPKRPRPTDNRIEVGFWYATPNGPRRDARKIVAPAWDDITGNYGARTREQLTESMRNFKPSHGGQIILWHGEPGTGKTYALRALCRAWREWCSAEYIVDPDHAFGMDTAYLMQLLLNGASDDPMSEDAEADERWRLLILEDTGELINEQARQDAGPGLSRLLNIADGFLGQGLRVLVLITTNEKMERLHPAVSRPGRAASVVLFDRLTAQEAASWRYDHGMPLGQPDGATIASLYAEVEEFAVHADERPKVGFRITV